LGGITLTLVVFLDLAWDKIDEHGAADIKYRELRLWGNEPLQRILNEADSEYVADPQGMEKSVKQEEQRRLEVQQTQERLEENWKEIRELEDKKRQPVLPTLLLSVSAEFSSHNLSCRLRSAV